jgi:hypothetical protein
VGHRGGDPSGVEPKRRENSSDHRPRGFVLRPPWAVVDTEVFARIVAARDPAWRDLERYSGPLPPEAVEALELANEVLG